jgi:hypothetical protein
VSCRRRIGLAAGETPPRRRRSQQPRGHRGQASRSWSQALLIAAPLMSAPLEAAVALALGTFCVSVAVTRTSIDRDAQAVGCHLGHLGVQALAHFGAAVVH